MNHYGHYEFLMIIFGLTNNLAAFMILLNDIFKYFLDSIMIVFVDDIFVYSNGKEKCASHLCIVSRILKEKQLDDKFSKYEF